MQNISLQSKVIFLLIFLALIWGSSFILMKKGLMAFTPLEVGAIRITVAAACFLPIAIRSFSKLSRRDGMMMALLGLIGNGIPAFLFPLAETKINSATAGMLNSLTPMFALLLGVLLFGVAFSWKKTAGIVIGFLGALLLMLSSEREIINQVEEPLRITLIYSSFIVLGTLLYGLNVNLMKRYLNHVPSLQISTFSLFWIGIPYAIYLLLFSQVPEKIQTHPEGMSSLMFVAILGVGSTAISTVLFYRLVQWTDAVVSSSVTYLMPIVALAWGFYLEENINAWQIGGMFVILSGVYLVNKKEG
ncbi:MAG: DMT family transporter [Bacteroidia bacterium]